MFQELFFDKSFSFNFRKITNQETLPSCPHPSNKIEKETKIHILDIAQNDQNYNLKGSFMYLFKFISSQKENKKHSHLSYLLSKLVQS